MIGRLEFENPPKASYTALTTATYSTIEKVGGESTANTAVKVKDSIFGGINAFASVILADSTGKKAPPNQSNERISFRFRGRRFEKEKNFERTGSSTESTQDITGNLLQ